VASRWTGEARLSNDAARDGATDVLARLRDQLADIAALQKKQAALELSAQVADGTVEVTVNARGQLVKTVIDKSYLDDHDFEELGGYITEAAQTAAGDAAGRVAEMLAPIAERRKSFPSLADMVEGLPDFGDVMAAGLDGFAAASQGGEGPGVSSAGAIDDGGDEAGFPTVRR
jgi:DNA-binding protein YbaB